MNRLWIVYDKRALLFGTDNAQVLVTCGTEEEAWGYAEDFPGCPVYSYDQSGEFLADKRYEFSLVIQEQAYE